MIGPTEPRITLLVVPPDTGHEIAHQVLMTAARRDNIDTIDELLTPTTTTQPIPTTSDLLNAAEQRWEADNGRVHEPVTTPRIPQPR